MIQNHLINAVILNNVGVPQCLRSDYGTENCLVASLHIAFHLKNQSGLAEKSYIYGPSKRNVMHWQRSNTCLVFFLQRIESWWSQLRKSKTSWWIDTFNDLKERGLFDGSRFHK